MILPPEIVELEHGGGKLRVLGVVFRWIFILSLPVMLLSASIAWGFNSTWLFAYGFEKYNASQATGLPDSELEKIGGSWVRYINSDEEFWRVSVTRDGNSFELFTPDEQIHFKDVKQLIWLDYRFLLATLIIVLAYGLASVLWREGRYRRMLARSVVWGSILTIALIALLGVASFVNFDWLFLQLHYVIFTNELWSATGYMLLLFPGGLWYDAALFCIGFMAGLALILGAAAVVYIRISKSLVRSTD